MSPPAIGPIRWATLLAPSIDVVVDGYRAALDVTIDPMTPLDRAEADRLGLEDLADAPTGWLRRPDGTPFLRLVEDPHAIDAGPPMHRDGWMALECLVDAVDDIVARLPPAFTVLGPPADLDVSPRIRAAQVLGPCGELWYLTQVRAEVPPFDLPLSGREPPGIFIGVIRCHDRDAERAFWLAAGGGASWTFDTRITVLNRALGRPLDDRHPVAVVQLAGRSLVEIDEVRDVAATKVDGRPRGVWSLAIARSDNARSSVVSPAGARIAWLAPNDPAGSIQQR
jgi:hypothetical protein